ncbi:hypothetical protein DY138_04630 [Apilactobacillus timberlakei]|uniref:hypothetical protein n=1 Tax=Apilactobacillus timberlakei TaxID=2008380 RepID=UPI00112DF9CE|nr:hypothetical protein [Apilactobacillus timberlakei]TPR18905.1 hypothetical protein DY138_04630 [Apilactobacillus timberlakei]TPR20931.1 hypothetical protein DY061_02510 [Apilactobacillus timberlakei]TPR23582.1 hypothetical protein DY083_00380 [Apilactobacillus timberlakei]
MKFRRLISISLITASTLLFVGTTGNNNVSANTNHHKRVHKVVNKKNKAHKQSKKRAFKPVINKWYKGTPKRVHGTWYYNGRDTKAYITYDNYKSSGNYMYKDDDDNLYEKEPAEGVKNIEYRYLGGYTYQFRGVQYELNDQHQMVSKHQYYPYKLKIYPDKLHFYLGHGIQDYVRKADFNMRDVNKK